MSVPPVGLPASALAAIARMGDVGAIGGATLGARQVTAAGQSEDFVGLLKRAVGEVGGLQAQHQDILTRFLRGDAVELHDVMAAAQEANLALELLVEMRNKLTTTLQTLLQVQI